MIIQGYFIGDAPYFPVHFRHEEFEGAVWLLADTGASRTTLLDRDIELLGLPSEALAPAQLLTVGVGGNFVVRQELWVVRHDLARLPPEEVARILRLPSVMGRDIINSFRFICDYQVGQVRLERT